MRCVLISYFQSSRSSGPAKIMGLNAKGISTVSDRKMCISEGPTGLPNIMVVSWEYNGIYGVMRALGRSRNDLIEFGS